MDAPNYYAVIPASVRYDARLKPIERLLYGELTALAQKDGYAWASNRYFADLYGVSKETVSRYLSDLQSCGYIKICLDSECGMTRRILILGTALTELSAPMTELSRGIDQTIKGYCANDQDPHDRTVKQNNTSITNKKNNKKQQGVFEEFAGDNQELLSAFRGFEEMRKTIKKPMTDRARKMLLTELTKLSKDPAEQIELLNHAVMHSWQSVYPIRDRQRRPAAPDYSEEF